MAQVFKCDACHEVDTGMPRSSHKSTVSKSGAPSVGTYADKKLELCGTCADSFDRWVRDCAVKCVSAPPEAKSS